MAHILTVDDSASMREMVAFTLRDAGFEVTQAVDGQDALAKAKAKPFQVVITDLHMPKMDGISLIRELRKLQEFRFTPLLLLTTETAVDRKAEAKTAGATGWLVKPFNPDQLLSTIRKVIS